MNPVNAGNFSDTAMLIPLTTDLHLALLPGVEDELIVLTVVFCGIDEGSSMIQIAVNK